MTTPAEVPLPPSPPPFSPPSPFSSTSNSHISPHLAFPRRPSLTQTVSDTQSRRSSTSHTPSLSAFHSPRITFRPRLDRSFTALRREKVDPFHEGATIEVNQPVGSLSISPSNRDVCLASRKGLYIIDLANLNNAPRFIPQGGTWQIADVQWSPHPVTSNLILSTSSQKLLVWDLTAQVHLHRSIDAHSRAITDINWHARDPNIMATTSMDAGIRAWDLRGLDRPVMRLCAWGQAGTQVKWNRQHDHLLATAHGKEVLVWDNRKGSVPVVAIRAHDAKIYGIDWDRQWRHKLVTCSLDKTIKYWTVPDLRTSAGATDDSFYPDLPAPDEATSSVRTSYPVWRARNLPFGHGVLALPQRGSDHLEMFALGSETPVERFEGHNDVVKDFVWRSRGGEDANFENREFQLVTWSKDHTLRVWPVPRETAEKVGFQYGAPIHVLVSRRGAKDISYTTVNDVEKKALPPPIVNPPSGIAKAKAVKQAESGMTRGGGRAVGMDQLDWLTKVVKNKGSPDNSAQPSRMGSVSRPTSRSVSRERKRADRGVSVGFGEREGWISLKDEIVLVNRLFPRPRISFEKIDLHHRKLTMSMLGPWANGERMAFIRIHWHFPPQYPYQPEIPTFELERNPTVSPIVRQDMIMTIKALRAENRQCLVSTSSYLVGEHQRLGRTRMNLDSDSDSESGAMLADNVVMLTRTSGATFGPNGELVCFFPKQTILPRIRAMSRSPSISRTANPLLKAMSALATLSNPNAARAARPRPRVRRARVEIAPQAVQAGSTMTIHNVSPFGNPSKDLARRYGIPSESGGIERMIRVASEVKRLDHVLILETLRGVLQDPPPPYSRHPPYPGQRDLRLERERWERGVATRRELLDQIFETLIAFHDFQMLALVSVLVARHIRNEVVPALPDQLVAHSPEQDYFGLPRTTSFPTPSRSRTSLTGNSPGHALGAFGIQSFSHRNSTQSIYGSSAADRSNTSGVSAWSSILNPSSLRLGSDVITRKDRSSFDLPFGKSLFHIGGTEEGSPTPGNLPSQSQGQTHASFSRTKSSPRVTDFGASRGSGSADSDRPRRHRDSEALGDRIAKRPSQLSMGVYTNAAPPSSDTTPTPGERPGGVGYTPLKSADTERSFGSADAGGVGGSGSSGKMGRFNSAGHHDRAGSSGWVGRSSVSGSAGLAGSGSGSGGKVWSDPASPVRRTGARRSMRPAEASLRETAVRRRTCGIRIELNVGDEDVPTLLPPERLRQCEAWKLAYADFLFRSELYGLRAELLAVRFVGEHAAGPGGQDAAASGSREDKGFSIACITCGAGDPCPACEKRPIAPLCAFCRLPIKGLSTTCAICSHKMHLTCLRLHSRSSLTCPACPCRCASEGGLSSGSIAFAPTATSPNVDIAAEDVDVWPEFYATSTPAALATATFARPGVSVVGAQPSKSWTVLDKLREQDRAASYGEAGHHLHPNPQAQAHPQSHRPSFGAFASSGAPGASALGLGLDGGRDTPTIIEDEDYATRDAIRTATPAHSQNPVDAGGTAQPGGASGIFARARAVMDAGGAWKSHGL